MRRIEVDDQVFNYLKTKAEPLVDTPNTVLRRLLLQETTEGISDKLYEPPRTPFPVPKALEQILQVIHEVRKNKLSRSEATHLVAKTQNVAYQTVVDKYTRQLNMTAYQFDGLLAQPDLSNLRALLDQKFNNCHAVIEAYLSL